MTLTGWLLLLRLSVSAAASELSSITGIGDLLALDRSVRLLEAGLGLVYLPCFVLQAVFWERP